MKTCPYCGSPIKEEDVFCNQCGKALTQTCPNCGEKIEADAIFCRECGYELNRTDNEPEGTNSQIKPPVPLYKKWWFWLCTVAAIIGLILLFASGGSRENTSSAEERSEAFSNEEHKETFASSTDSADAEEDSATEAQTAAIRDKKKAAEIVEFQEKVEGAMKEAFPENPGAKDSEKNKTMEIEEFQAVMEEVLIDAFGEGCFETNLDTEKKLYNVYAWMDGGKESMEAAKDGDQEDVTYWNARVGLLLEISEKIKEKLDSEGLSKWSVTLSLLDEFTHDEIYAITKDGNIYYEILKDGKLDV